MSEDVKPKQIWVYNTNDFRCHTRTSPPTTDYDKIAFTAVIELEPTMRMMDEMAEAVEKGMSHDFDCGITVNGRHECSCNYLKAKEALEKYKKFKEGLK